MYLKRMLILALTAAVFAAITGCGWRRSSCRTSELPCEPDCRYYQSNW